MPSFSGPIWKVISPLMSYFPIIVGFAAKYSKNEEDMGMGTIIAMMLPYSMAYTLRKLRDNNKALFGRQRQGAEAPGASGEDLGTNQEEFTVYSVVKTRAIPPGCAMSPSRSKRR